MRKRLRIEMKLVVDNFMKSCIAQYRDTRMKRMVGSRSLWVSHPRYRNLFGQVEHSSDQGMLVTSYRWFVLRSLMRKRRLFDYLVQRNCSQSLFVEALKRAFEKADHKIETSPYATCGLMNTNKRCRQQNLPLQVQVVLIGRVIYYYLLQDGRSWFSGNCFVF